MTATAMGAGYAAALDEAHDKAAPGMVLIGPHGFAYVSAARLLATGLPTAASVTSHCADARSGAALRADGVEKVEADAVLRLGIDCLRLVRPEALAETVAVPAVFRHHLLLAHTTVLTAVVEHTVTDLDTRSAEGKPLLGRQLVQGTIADAHLLTTQSRGQLDAGCAVDPAVCAVLFGRLVRGGRRLLRLLGAASFVADGPGGTLMAVEHVGTLYLAGEASS